MARLPSIAPPRIHPQRAQTSSRTQGVSAISVRERIFPLNPSLKHADTEPSNSTYRLSNIWDINLSLFSFLRRKTAYSLLGFCSLWATGNADTHLVITAIPQVIIDFNKWTAITPWEKIESFNSPYATRPVVELVLQLKALKSGGLEFDFTLAECPNYERAKLTVLRGEADLFSATIWNRELTNAGDTVHITEPIIRQGEFVKGIYVLPTNEKMLKIASLDELKTYTAAVVKTWELDMKTLVDMNLKGIETPGSVDAVFLMIQKGRADFTIQEFTSAPDMASVFGGVKLIPIPLCTVALASSRSWIVSTTRPQAKEIMAALTKGITNLRAIGTIEKAYSESGFFNLRVKDWKRLF